MGHPNWKLQTLMPVPSYIIENWYPIFVLNDDDGDSNHNMTATGTYDVKIFEKLPTYNLQNNVIWIML